MTLKALEVLKKRGGKDGFFLMSEAASVDKQVRALVYRSDVSLQDSQVLFVYKLHPLDFSRAWGELIEMDVTIKKTIEWLKVSDLQLNSKDQKVLRYCPHVRKTTNLKIP